MKFFLLDSSGKVDLNWYIAYENRCSRSGDTGQFRENPIVFLELKYYILIWNLVGAELVLTWCRVGRCAVGRVGQSAEASDIL